MRLLNARTFKLSEAINSTFSWYQGAQVCYAYLSDVTWSPTGDSRRSRFTQSRWFTRGWTLQELLAPQTLIFYDAHWFPLGSKADRSLGIKAATGISAEYLTGKKRLHDASIAQRMSWAANRQTQRKEYIAYSLLGIFGVNMPMLYGEGAKAFIRLQEEIIKESRDLSIFAWGLKMPWSWHDGVPRCSVPRLASFCIARRSSKSSGLQAAACRSRTIFLRTRDCRFNCRCITTGQAERHSSFSIAACARKRGPCLGR